MPNAPHGSTLLFRAVAMGVLSLTIIACGLMVLGAMNHADTTEPIPTLYTPAILTLIGGIAIATLLEGMARLVSASTEVNDSVAITTAANRLFVSMNELKASLPELIARGRQATQPTQAALPLPEIETAAEPAPQGHLEQHMERMVKLLEEMKEMSMLDEAQRAARRKQGLTRRKATRIEEAARFINNQDWTQADSLLHLLESLHPQDAEVQTLRTELDNARISTQAEGWDRLRDQVDGLMALSNYADAHAAIMQFLERYPTHTDAQQLALRVKQEQAAYTEGASSRMYDEIKSNVQNRKWRVALDGIQSFLERFPDNSRAIKIRQQLRVIQKNAEIEERHEQEARIRELISARQFAEAADLADDLLQRFPESPQAAYLSELLPKLRDRSGVELQS